jgi:hypothetical protein
MASFSKESLASGAITAATTNGTAKNIAPKAKKLILCQIVSACNGATTVTGKVQHSPDGTNWFDLATFTDVVGVAGSEIKIPTTSDTFFQNLRSVIVLAGVTKSATVAIDAYYEPN